MILRLSRPEKLRSFTPKNQESYQNLFQLAEHVRNVIVQGIDDIERSLSEKEGEYILYTEGSNPKMSSKSKESTASRTRSNNISEIADVLGIEAGGMQSSRRPDHTE